MSLQVKSSEEQFSFSSSVVASFANIEFSASLFQDGDHPGITMKLSATLKEFGKPVHQATVHAKVVLPDDTTTQLSFQETQSGHFKADYQTTIPGVYKFHVQAKGTTHNGTPFTFEKTLMGAVYFGD